MLRQIRWPEWEELCSSWQFWVSVYMCVRVCVCVCMRVRAPVCVCITVFDYLLTRHNLYSVFTLSLYDLILRHMKLELTDLTH